MPQYRILSMCPTSSPYRAVFFDVEEMDADGNPTMFHLPVAAFGVVDTSNRKGMAGPLVPQSDAGLVPAWLLKGYLDCAPEEDVDGDDEFWLKRWKEENPEEEEKPKKKTTGKKKGRKTEPAEEEEEEQEEDGGEEEEEEEEEEEDPPTAEVHMGGRRR